MITFMLSFVSVSSNVLAAHTSSVDLQPEWSTANADIDYTVTFCRETGDDINEVRIYKNYDGSVNYTNFQCDDKLGWEKLYISTYPACFYVAKDPSHYLNDTNGNCENFTFSAHSPGPGLEYCNLQWRFETRDTSDYWQYLYDNTSVDDKKPVIIKTLGEPKIDKNSETWITQDTEIKIEAYDQGDCGISGIDYCEYRYDVDGVEKLPWTQIQWQNVQLGNPPHYFFKFTYNEDSLHHLEIKCYDVAGNMAYHEQYERVDSAYPETTKQFIGPKKEEGGVEWIDGVTNISLTSTDPDPTGEGCNIGVKETYWKNIIINDPEDWGICYEPELHCNPQDFDMMAGITFSYDDGDWNAYDDVPFSKDLESCHVLAYWSEDELGNKEEIQYNCFFVDKKAPYMDKDNGNAIEDSDENWEGTFHWITTEMPITFTCDDTRDVTGADQPHPSEDEELCFKVSYDYAEIDEGVYDWGYVTQDYCYYYNGEFIPEEGDCGDECGYCCVPVGQEDNDLYKKFVFNFQNESMHNLEYYCKDAVDKKTDPEIQYYKVDDTPPSITKTMIGEDHLGDCPPTDPEDVCYVRDDGQNGVHVAVQDGGAICAVDQTTCEYELWWITDLQECQDEFDGTHLYNFETGQCFVEGGQFGEEGKDILFHQDSTHILTINCEDALGNKMIEDVEEFLVDQHHQIRPRCTEHQQKLLMVIVG